MDHLVITSEKENAVYGTTSNCWGIGLNCVAQSLIYNNFRRVVNTCQRRGTGTMQVGPLGKIGCFFVPTLRNDSVVSQGHFFGDPDNLTEFHRKFLKNKGTCPSEAPTAQNRQNFAFSQISLKRCLYVKNWRKQAAVFFAISLLAFFFGPFLGHFESFLAHFWPISGHLGPQKVFLGHFFSSWVLFWSQEGPPDIEISFLDHFWAILGHFWPILGHLVPFTVIYGHKWLRWHQMAGSQ